METIPLIDHLREVSRLKELFDCERDRRYSEIAIGSLALAFLRA